MSKENRNTWPSDAWYRAVAEKHSAYEALQAPYVRATDKPQEEEDPIFHADAMVGQVVKYVGTLLAGIGIGATIVALCVWVAVRGGV